MPIPIGEHAGYALKGLHRVDKGAQHISAEGSLRRRNFRRHKNDGVRERRPEAALQLFVDCDRFASVHTSGDSQHGFDPPRSRQQEDAGEDPGQCNESTTTRCVLEI